MNNKEKVGFFRRLVSLFRREKKTIQTAREEVSDESDEMIYDVIRGSPEPKPVVAEPVSPVAVEVKDTSESSAGDEDSGIVQVVEVKEKPIVEYIEGFEEEREITELETKLREKRLELEKKIKEKEESIAEIERREREIQVKEEKITLKEKELNELEKELAEREKEINELKQMKEDIERRERELADKEKELAELSQELEKGLTKKGEIEVIDEDVKKLLPILDQLLGKLPTEVIDEFVQSEDYVLYEKLLKKYGI